jgi:hypothetical protein
MAACSFSTWKRGRRQTIRNHHSYEAESSGDDARVLEGNTLSSALKKNSDAKEMICPCGSGKAYLSG